MRILSIKEAANALGVSNLADFYDGMDWQYADPVPSYFLPNPPGERIGLARIVANTFLEQESALLWITYVNRGSSIEHMDMFDRYRLSYGETRTVEEAPVHIFDMNERDTFMSILCFGLFFSWDIEVVSYSRKLAMTFSHDDWTEYRFAPGHEAFVPYFEKYLGWLGKNKN